MNDNKDAAEIRANSRKRPGEYAVILVLFIDNTPATLPFLDIGIVRKAGAGTEKVPCRNFVWGVMQKSDYVGVYVETNGSTDSIEVAVDNRLDVNPYVVRVELFTKDLNKGSDFLFFNHKNVVGTTTDAIEKYRIGIEEPDGTLTVYDEKTSKKKENSVQLVWP